MIITVMIHYFCFVYFQINTIVINVCCALSILTVLIAQLEQHPACKKCVVVLVVQLSQPPPRTSIVSRSSKIQNGLF